MARQHPSETASSFVCEFLIKCLLDKFHQLLYVSECLLVGKNITGSSIRWPTPTELFTAIPEPISKGMILIVVGARKTFISPKKFILSMLPSPSSNKYITYSIYLIFMPIVRILAALGTFLKGMKNLRCLIIYFLRIAFFMSLTKLSTDSLIKKDLLLEHKCTTDLE